MARMNTLESDDDLRRRVVQRVNKRREFMMHASAFGLIIAVGWVLMLVFGLTSFWWLLVAVTLGWGSGLAGHAIDTYYQIGPPAEQLDEEVWQDMRSRFGPDWRSVATQKEYNETRFRLSRNMNRMKELLIHGAVFLIINVMIWVLWGVAFAPFVQNAAQQWGASWLEGLAGGSQLIVPLLVTFGWGIGMAFHIAEVLTSRNRTQAVENAVERERDRMARLEGAAKRKNEERQTSMRVGDDGELIEFLDDDPVEQKAKRG